MKNIRRKPAACISPSKAIASKFEKTIDKSQDGNQGDVGNLAPNQDDKRKKAGDRRRVNSKSGGASATPKAKPGRKWTVEVKVRKEGKSKGNQDKYYWPPGGGKPYNSLPKAIAAGYNPDT
jgi:hypothetical protein